MNMVQDGEWIGSWQVKQDCSVLCAGASGLRINTRIFGRRYFMGLHNLHTLVGGFQHHLKHFRTNCFFIPQAQTEYGKQHGL